MILSDGIVLFSLISTRSAARIVVVNHYINQNFRNKLRFENLHDLDIREENVKFNCLVSILRFLFLLNLNIYIEPIA